MAAAYVFGYRLALLAAGAGAFYIAEYSSWTLAYLCMAGLMLVGIVTTLGIAEPEHPPPDDAVRATANPDASLVQRLLAWLRYAVMEPFVEFFRRNGRMAVFILLLIGLYKVSDITLAVMANPFYLDLGFSKAQIADITKIFGFFMTLIGAGLGGILVARYGVLRPLLLGAILAASTTLLFAGLALLPPSLPLLALVVSADHLSGGIGASVFIAYLSGLTNKAYTATQYALFSSLMTLPAKLTAGFSGVIVDGYGYASFFVYAACIGLPAIGLAWYLLHLDSTRNGLHA
jgi:PAT family beta-lactamase induction signal transducer AmpG